MLHSPVLMHCALMLSLLVAIATAAGDAHVPQAAMPEILPAMDIFVLIASLDISSTTPSATIYYTLDGTDPTVSSLSIAPSERLILVEIGTRTVKACASAENFRLSNTTSKTLTILDRLRGPTIRPQSSVGSGGMPRGEPGAHVGDLVVKLDCSATTAGGGDADHIRDTRIFYTDDGMSTPHTLSPSVPCGGEITLRAPGIYTVRTIASAPGLASSAIVQQEFRLNLSPYDEVLCKAELNRYSPKAQVSVDTVVFSKPGSSACNSTAHAVSGRLASLDNPIGHFNIIPPAGSSCAAGSSLSDVLSSSLAYEYDMSVAALEEALSPYERRVLLQHSTELDWRQWHKEYAEIKKVNPGGGGCELAASAGYFDVVSHACFGSIVSSGVVLASDSGKTGAHVSMGMRNGSLVTGSIHNEEIGNQGSHSAFSWLVSGSGWLVRNGRSYVEESLSLDDEDMTLMQQPASFIDGALARTVFGHDRDGRLLILHVNGYLGTGLSLSDAATWAAELGFLNAINLVGGDYSALAQHGTVVSTASGLCSADKSVSSGAASGSTASRRCEQAVSTVACMHTMAPPAGTPAADPSESDNTHTTAPSEAYVPTAWPSYDWAAPDDPPPMLNATQNAQNVINSLEARLQYFQETTLTLGSVCVVLLFMLAYSYSMNAARSKHSHEANVNGSVDLAGMPNRGVQFIERRVQDPRALPQSAAPEILPEALLEVKRPESIYNLKSGTGSTYRGRWQDRIGTLTLESESESESDGPSEHVDFRGRMRGNVSTSMKSSLRRKGSAGTSGSNDGSLMNPVHVHSPLPANSMRTPTSTTASTSYVSLRANESDSDEELNPFSGHV